MNGYPTREQAEDMAQCGWGMPCSECRARDICKNEEDFWGNSMVAMHDEIDRLRDRLAENTAEANDELLNAEQREDYRVQTLTAEIDRLRAEVGRLTPSPERELMDRVKANLEQGQLIRAIKEYMSAKNCGLTEARNACYAIRDSYLSSTGSRGQHGMS